MGELLKGSFYGYTPTIPSTAKPNDRTSSASIKSTASAQKVGKINTFMYI